MKMGYIGVLEGDTTLTIGCLFLQNNSKHDVYIEIKAERTATEKKKES